MKTRMKTNPGRILFMLAIAMAGIGAWLVAANPLPPCLDLKSPASSRVLSLWMLSDSLDPSGNLTKLIKGHVHEDGSVHQHGDHPAHGHAEPIKRAANPAEAASLSPADVPSSSASPSSSSTTTPAPSPTTTTPAKNEIIISIVRVDESASEQAANATSGPTSTTSTSTTTTTTTSTTSTTTTTPPPPSSSTQAQANEQTSTSSTGNITLNVLIQVDSKSTDELINNPDKAIQAAIQEKQSDSTPAPAPTTTPTAPSSSSTTGATSEGPSSTTSTTTPSSTTPVPATEAPRVRRKRSAGGPSIAQQMINSAAVSSAMHLGQPTSSNTARSTSTSTTTSTTTPAPPAPSSSSSTTTTTTTTTTTSTAPPTSSTSTSTSTTTSAPIVISSSSAAPVALAAAAPSGGPHESMATMETIVSDTRIISGGSASASSSSTTSTSSTQPPAAESSTKESTTTTSTTTTTMPPPSSSTSTTTPAPTSTSTPAPSAAPTTTTSTTTSSSPAPTSTTSTTTSTVKPVEPAPVVMVPIAPVATVVEQQPNVVAAMAVQAPVPVPVLVVAPADSAGMVNEDMSEIARSRQIKPLCPDDGGPSLAPTTIVNADFSSSVPNINIIGQPKKDSSTSSSTTIDKQQQQNNDHNHIIIEQPENNNNQHHQLTSISITNTNYKISSDNGLPKREIESAPGSIGLVISSANLDNQNVIYDNDTTIELTTLNLMTGTNQPTSNGNQTTSANHVDAIPMESAPTDSHQQQTQTGSKLKAHDAFINSDHNDEIEKENYGLCRLSTAASDPAFFGRLSFWQPMNNAGVMHLVAKIRYTKQQQYPNIGSGSPTASQRRRRESFRAPIERPPVDGISPEQEAIRQRNRHQIWLVDECQSLSASITKKSLVAELNLPLNGKQSAQLEQLHNQHTPTITTSDVNPTTQMTNSQIVSIDAELMIPNYNLTGTNEIASKFLMLEMPNGLPLACCQVNISSQAPPAGELDSWMGGSVSVVQPIRDDLLAQRLREPSSNISMDKIRS